MRGFARFISHYVLIVLVISGCNVADKPVEVVAQPLAEVPVVPTIPPELFGVAVADFSTMPTDDEAAPYLPAWDRIIKAWNLNSPNEIRDACYSIYNAKSFYPSITMRYVLDSLAAQIMQTHTGDDAPNQMHIARVADEVYAALEDSYYAPIEAAQQAQAESDAALQENIAANQAAARERGASRNQAIADKKRAAAENQQYLQDRRAAAVYDHTLRQVQAGKQRPESMRNLPPLPNSGVYTGSTQYNAAPQTLSGPRNQIAGTVWVAPQGGKRYHVTSACYTLRNAGSRESMSTQSATNSGYTPCQICCK